MGLRAKANITNTQHNKCNIKLRRASNTTNTNTNTNTTVTTKAKSNCDFPMSKAKQTQQHQQQQQQTIVKPNTEARKNKIAAAANDLAADAMTNATATFRSSSTASLITKTITKATTTATTATNKTITKTSSTSSVCLRPQTLNVQHPRETPTDQTQLFFGEVLNAWRAKARCNVVPADRTQELFHELSFHPSEKQISEMLQTAKMLARKGSRQSNGLTFGEFCVLAADLKRFRASTYNAPTNICDKVNLLSSLKNEQNKIDDHFDEAALKSGAGDPDLCETKTKNSNSNSSNNSGTDQLHKSTNTNTNTKTNSMRKIEDCSSTNTTKRKISSDSSTPVEVFLGGSCNPTTWRADVAIPALQELGISFYNPQVSDWTPDLIELEHRAKEKARVLFFVMDSETRASAGAIEAAHIAGQNCKQLVLVLHPYKPNQYILNEPISSQEFLDLSRNQMILRELVTRRGLPVLDNIPSALQRTKEILAGIRDPPSNIASILVVVRGAFDRVNPVHDVITVSQCQRALLYLGYAQSLVSLDNLYKIIGSQRESLDALRRHALHNKSTESACSSSLGSLSSSSIASDLQTDNSTIVDFELFCIISAYLSVLQQEIHESGCISPIKGTNVPPPPVYLANLQGDENFTVSYYSSSKNISRTSSNTSVPGGSCEEQQQRQCLNELLGRSRDSGTSSPQLLDLPLKSKSATNLGKTKIQTQILVNFESIETSTEITKKNPITANRAALAFAHHPSTAQSTSTATAAAAAAAVNATTTIGNMPLTPSEEESDSNDSVFSSSSSINSINCSNYGGDNLSFSMLDFRDVYLGGSCALRTKWRQDVAMPYLKSKSITFHMPALHESIPASQLELAENSHEDSSARTFMRTRRKNRTASATATATQHDEDDVITVSEETLTWSLPPVRQNLFNPTLLDSSRVLLFVITNETRSLAPMTLAAHCIGLMYNVVLTVQMLPENCIIGNEKLTPAAIKDYNRGRSYLIDLAKRQGVPVFNDLKAALECTIEKVKACNSRGKFD